MQEAPPYYSSSEERTQYQKHRILDADALLLGRKTYEKFSEAYVGMASTGKGAPIEFVHRMNSIPKYVISRTLNKAAWNATLIQGDLVEEVRKIKDVPGKNIVKYGMGSLDRVLFAHGLVDLLCIIVYPFVLGRGTYLFEGPESTMHMHLSDVKRWAIGAVVLEYTPRQ